MARTISTANLNAIAANGYYPINLVKIIVDPDVDSSNLYLSSAYRDITYDGNTYDAAGHLLGVTTVQEDRDIRTNAVTLRISGLAPAIINDLSGDNVIGSAVTIYRGYVNQAVNASTYLVDDPYERWSGIVNNFTGTATTESDGTITLQVECKGLIEALFNTNSGRFTNNSSFQQFNSTDRSMEFIPSLTSWNPRFGGDN